MTILPLPPWWITPLQAVGPLCGWGRLLKEAASQGPDMGSCSRSITKKQGIDPSVLDKIQVWEMASHTSKSPFWVSTKSHYLLFPFRTVPCWEQRWLCSHPASPTLSLSVFSLPAAGMGEMDLLLETVYLPGCVTLRAVLHRGQ